MPSPSHAEPRSPLRRRAPLPGRGFLLAGTGLFVLSLAPIFAPALATLWTAAALLVALVATVDFLVRPPPRSVRVSRLLDGDYRVGREASYRLRLDSASPRRLRLRVREVLAATCEPREQALELELEPGESAEVPIRFIPLERGRASLERPTLRLESPLRFFWVQERAGSRDEIVVLPGRPTAETGDLLARAAVLEEEGQRLVRRRGQDREFESLRDYVVGDDLRLVDWKATARRLRPQVRQFQMERNTEVILALDCGRLMGTLVRGVSKLDLSMVSLLDLAAVAIQRRERVGLLAFDSDVLAFVPPRSGLRQLGVLTRSLGGLATGFHQTVYSRAVAHLEANQRKRSLLIVFTDFTDEITSRDLQLVLATLARRHVLVFVAVGDHHLEDILSEEPRSAAAVYQKAAAGELLAERRRVIEALSRRGVLTLDADPFHLGAPLIRRYLEAHARV